MNLDFLKKLPLFKNSDFSKREDRTAAVKFLGLLVVIIVIILLSVLKGGDDTGKPIRDEREKERTETARHTPASAPVDIQRGEDLDVLDSGNNMEAIERSRSDRRSRRPSAIDIYENSDTESGTAGGAVAVGTDDDIMSSLNREKNSRPASQRPRTAEERRARADELLGLNSRDENGNPETDIYGEAGRKSPRRTTPQDTRPPHTRPDASSQYSSGSQIQRVRPTTAEDLSGRQSGPTAGTTATTPAPAAQQAQTADVRPSAPAPVRVKRSGGLSGFDDPGTDTGISSFDDDSRYISSDDIQPVKAAFIRAEKLTNGQRVSIRLLEDMYANGVLIQKNSHLSATVAIGERVQLVVSNVEINGKIHPVNCVAYDNDGNEGLYCPQTENEKTKKSLVRSAESIGQSALNTAISGLGNIVSSAVNTGVQVVNDKTNRQTVTVSPGYSFYLIQESEMEKYR